MKQYLTAASKLPILFLTFVGTLMMTAYILPLLPIGGEPFDLMSSYTYEEALSQLETYGPEGRAVYLRSEPVLDTIFPILYVTFFAGLLYRLRPSDMLWPVALLPVAAGLADLTENAHIITMLLTYPDVPPGLVASSSFFTQTKNVLVLAFQLATGIFVAIFCVRWVFERLRG